MIKDHEEDDNRIWKHVTKDVKKLENPEKTGSAPKTRRIRVREFIPITLPLDLKLPSGGGIDRKTEDRVRKGEMKIDGRLDLHGHTLSAARAKLLQFIGTGFSSGKRTLLVITGKGREKGEVFGTAKGAINREFRLWLEDASVKPYILSVAQAQPKHGGSGAYYIYLRKLK